MKPEIVLTHEFVEFVPDEMRERTLYVSIRYKTVVHLCCCGCGRQVATPLSPTAWKLTFDGVSISLKPSVGSWSLPCQSHYWIERNRAIWCKQWSREEIEAGRATEALAKARYFGSETPATAQPPDIVPIPSTSGSTTEAAKPRKTVPKESIWRSLIRWLFGS